MQPPFLLTQSRNLHNDSMWKKIKIESNTPVQNSGCSHLYPLFFNTLTPPRFPMRKSSHAGADMKTKQWRNRGRGGAQLNEDVI
jgi:hypothetical protein